MIIRRETPSDARHVDEVIAQGFAGSAPGGQPEEVDLMRRLRRDDGWLGHLSLVAESADAPGIVGHVVCTRGWLGGRPALGLAPLSVWPDVQGRGVGSALMHAVVAAADAREEEVIALLGDSGFYRRFGFVPARTHGVVPPDQSWGDHFQVRPLERFAGAGGTFQYAAAFGL